MAEFVDISADIERFRSMGLLNILLKDRSTGNNIRWASNVLEDKGESYAPADEILASDVTGDNAGLIRTRASKAKEAQAALTKAHAEVFTPTWVVSKMVSAADKAWWEAHPGAKWQDYVRSPRLEITCGEAPYLVNRYDAADGTPIDVANRIGVLDRKLKFVAKHTTSRKTWAKYAHMALQSTYGYEFQGDNLLIARVNVLATLEDFARAAGYEISRTMYERFATTISWNLWQMDGLTDAPPELAVSSAVEDEEPVPVQAEMDLSEWVDDTFVESTEQSDGMQLRLDGARICCWKGNNRDELWFSALKGEGAPMKFDYVLGNPPYQEETESDSTRKPPIYNLFMDASYELGSFVELITPARFLFNAGYTPKSWNRKMLDDAHFKVLWYEPDSSQVFSGVEIKGGVVITCHDAHRNYGAIGVFAKYPELNTVLKKVNALMDASISTIIYPTLSFKLSQLMLSEHPNTVGRLRTSAFKNLSEIFYETKPSDEHDYVVMVGILDGRRTRRYVRRDYLVDGSGTLDKYTLLVPNASGNGVFGERISEFEIAGPGVAYSQTFNAFGRCDSRDEACHIGKYIKTKFARALLGVLKITQHLSAPKWKYVPLQDFTDASDIDWSKSVSEIDQQLYEKYDLTQDEIDFIESHVKEMA